MDVSVQIQNLSITYGPVVAVDQLSATFPPGTTGLLGQNGAGKSSLIKGLLGLVPLSSGSVYILGKNTIQERKWFRQHIGYMPEDDCLIPGLSGLEMVRYAGELCGMNPGDAMQRAHEVLFYVGLGEARYRMVETYSSGMKQRIKLAQALVHDPQLLFLDEPTSGMDPKGRQEMLDVITEISLRSDKSIVLASHILVDVERTCQRVIIMHRGKILEEANLKDLKSIYTNTYLLRVEGDRDVFIEKLKRKGCQIQPEGKHHFVVTFEKGNTTEMILQTADEVGVILRKLTPSVQTLEDVFIDRIREDHSANL